MCLSRAILPAAARGLRVRALAAPARIWVVGAVRKSERPSSELFLDAMRQPFLKPAAGGRLGSPLSVRVDSRARPRSVENVLRAPPLLFPSADSWMNLP